MKINDILQSGVVQPNRGTSSRTSTTGPTHAAKAADFAIDRAEFHQEAKVEGQLLEGAKLVFEALPNIRADRVAQAKRRLDEGYYDRPEVIDQIATHLAADPEAQPSAPLSLAQQDSIKRRLAEGYYDTPEVIDKIAGSLAEEASV